jgi:hypothetical protein
VSKALKDHFKFLRSECCHFLTLSSYSDTNQGKKEVQCGTAVPVDQDDGKKISPSGVVKGFKEYCTSSEMDEKEAEEEVGSVGNECNSVNSKCGTEDGNHRDRGRKQEW